MAYEYRKSPEPASRVRNPNFPAPLSAGETRNVSVTGTRRAYGDQSEYSNGWQGRGTLGTTGSMKTNLGVRRTNTNRTGEDRIG